MVRLAVLGLCLILASCQQTDHQAIVFAVATAPSVLDPRLASDAASERTNALLYDRLVELDERGMPQSAMADWQQLDPQRFRLTLRPQRAAFWNGQQPNAHDVAATYRSILEPQLGSPHAGAFKHLQTIEVIDEVNLVFKLERADPYFASRLTLGIAPATAIQRSELIDSPMGSGPFVFVERRDDGGVLLKRRRDGQQIVLAPVADPTMRVLKLMRGEAQLLQNDLPTELYRYLDQAGRLEVAEQPGTTFAYIGFNLTDPILRNHDVRAAIAHAIDRDAIIQYLFAGRAQAAETVLRPEHWAGISDIQPYDYDPALARSLLRRAGYSRDKPLVLSYKTSTDPFRLRIAHVFQSQLAAVGINMKISSYDWGTFFGDIKAGRFQLYSLAWVGVNTPDILRYAFHSASLPPAGANRGGYRSAEADGLIEAAERAAPGTARELYATLQRRIHRDLVYVPLWYEANVAISSGLRGYRPANDGSYLALSSVEKTDASY